MTSGCREVRRLLEAYLDGELAPAQVLEVEAHAGACAVCGERLALDRAVRTAVARRVHARTAPDSLRARALASMDAERTRAEVRRQAGPPLGWRTVSAVAAAAAIPVAWGIAHPVTDRAGRDSAPVAVQSAAAPLDIDAVIDQFVEWHARPLPPEITNPSELPGFEPYVGVPLHAPSLTNMGARWVGGRMLAMRQSHPTAMLQYTLQGGHRVSVYVYDAHRMPAGPSRLRARVVGSEPVFVGSVHGYTVATAERRGVGYAVTTDLDDDESTDLALAAAP